MIVTFYDSDGRIVHSNKYEGLTSDEMAALMPSGGGIYFGTANAATEYFSNGDLTARPKIAADGTYRIAANGVATVTIPMPAGTRVIANSIKGMIDDSAGEDFVYSSEMPSDDDIVFMPPFPWVGRTIRIIAHAVDQ